MPGLKVLVVCFILFMQCRSDEDPGRDPCRTTGNGFGLTCWNITSDFFFSPMFLSLDDDIARFTGEMKRLEIQNSNITYLGRASFKIMRHLSYLIATNASLREIQPGAFEGLTNLKMVDLSYNLLESVPVDAFRDTRISYLNLKGNRRLQIPTNGPILEAKKLRSLILKDCNLQHLPGSAFTQLPGLSLLDISNNRLQMLPRLVFRYLPHLDYLDLSGNRFRTIDVAVFTSIPTYPRNPGSVILTGNHWLCDCRLAGLIRWVTKNGKSDAWTSIASISRLRKRTVCDEPERLKALSWNDPEMDKFVATC